MIGSEVKSAGIRINKLDAARRQLNAAIRMTFSGEDPAAIHTVAAVASSIIRSICEQRGDINGYERVKDRIAPGHEKEFWRAVNASANFLKHADRDPGAIHELQEEENDFVILLACRWHMDLGHTLSHEMRIFAAWFSICHPRVVSSSGKAAPDIQWLHS